MKKMNKLAKIIIESLTTMSFLLGTGLAQLPPNKIPEKQSADFAYSRDVKYNYENLDKILNNLIQKNMIEKNYQKTLISELKELKKLKSGTLIKKKSEEILKDLYEAQAEKKIKPNTYSVIADEIIKIKLVADAKNEMETEYDKSGEERRIPSDKMSLCELMEKIDSYLGKTIDIIGIPVSTVLVEDKNLLYIIIEPKTCNVSKKTPKVLICELKSDHDYISKIKAVLDSEIADYDNEPIELTGHLKPDVLKAILEIKNLRVQGYEIK